MERWRDENLLLSLYHFNRVVQVNLISYFSEHRHRHSGESKGVKSARLDARGFAASIVAGMKLEDEARRQSMEEQKQGNLGRQLVAR